MRTYELAPIDGRKSFYGKAKVIIFDNDDELLTSYDTKIMMKTKDGKFIKYFDGWTQTTGRHIKAFCGMNKKEFEQLECFQ